MYTCACVRRVWFDASPSHWQRVELTTLGSATVLHPLLWPSAVSRLRASQAACAPGALTVSTAVQSCLDAPLELRLRRGSLLDGSPLSDEQGDNGFALGLVGDVHLDLAGLGLVGFGDVEVGYCVCCRRDVQGGERRQELLADLGCVLGGPFPW